MHCSIAQSIKNYSIFLEYTIESINIKQHHSTLNNLPIYSGSINTINISLTNIYLLLLFISFTGSEPYAEQTPSDSSDDDASVENVNVFSHRLPEVKREWKLPPITNTTTS